jgi:hypothetical protein
MESQALSAGADTFVMSATTAVLTATTVIVASFAGQRVLGLR